MWDLLGILALTAVGAAVAPWIRNAIAARKTRRYEAGVATRIAVRVKGAPPFPRRWRSGSVDTADDPLVFRRWYRMGGEAPLTGLTLLGRHLDVRAPGPEPLVVFRFRDAAGAPVDVGVSDTQADLFETVLRAEPQPGPAAAPRRRVPRWRIALALLAVLWLAAWVYLAVAGSVLTRPVLANEDDMCHVEWTLGERTDDGWVDCYGQQPGETVRFVALPAPFQGEAVDVVTTRVVVPLFALPFLVPLALYGIGRLRRRAAPLLPVSRAPAVVGEVEVPPLEAHDLRWSAIEAHVRRRATDEQWRESWTTPWWARRFRSPIAQRVARSLPTIVLVPLGVLVAVAVYGWTPLVTAWRFDAANAREVVGTVVQIDGMRAPVPWDVEVEVVEGGRTEHVRVASLREPDYDTELTIRYDAAHDVARLVGDDDGVERGVLLSVVAVALVLAFALWRIAVLLYRLRRMRRARREPGTPMRYAVVQDFAAQPGVLLFDADRDLRPEAVVPIAYLPDVPLTGTVDVHGDVVPGNVVMLRVGETLLGPDGPVHALDTEDLLAVVNGTPPYDED